jgi:hypothetical protein
VPDSLTPVGAMVQPPNPNSALNTYGDILGIQQRRQALQTGQYQQQSAQANASQDQQRNQELQAAQALIQNGSRSGKYTNDDGSLNRQKMADDISSIGPYAQATSGQLLSQANEIVSNQQAVQNLTVSRKKEMADTISSLAADPNVDNSKVIDAIEGLRQAHPNDEQYSRLLTSQAMHLPSTGDPKVLQDYLGRWSAGLSGTPQVTPTTVSTPAGTQGATQNRLTGALNTSGGAVAAPPHQTTNAAGQIVNVTPAGTVSTAPTHQPSANPTTAQAATQNTIASGVAERVQQAQAAANNSPQAQDALTRARAILDAPGSPNTGAGFQNMQQLKNLMSTLGIDTQGATDANSLVKNLARYEASRATQAGLGGTDAARELAHNGSPNVNVDNAALKGIITQSLATEKALAAYANTQSKTKDPDALARNETAFRSIPNLIEGYEYGLARTPQEAEQFLQKHGISHSDMAKTRSQIKQFEGAQ